MDVLKQALVNWPGGIQIALALILAFSLFFSTFNSKFRSILKKLKLPISIGGIETEAGVGFALLLLVVGIVVPQKFFNNAPSIEAIPTEKIASYIMNLSQDDPLSLILYKLSREKVGPWNPYPVSTLLTVSIPSLPIKKGHAVVCPTHHKKNLQLLSALGRNDLDVIGERVDVIGSKLLITARNCLEISSVQMQIGCLDGQRLFPHLISGCGGTGEAEWFTQSQSLSVHAVVIED